VAIYSFDGNDLKMMLRGAVQLLGESKAEIDALNVFPVPDGDTGTNMHNTLTAALKEADAASTGHIGQMARAAAKGSLLGARGNSGVILSQILQGFADSLGEKEIARASDITRALQEGADLAYRGVMHPVEGTILTVARKSAEGAGSAAGRSRDLLRLMLSVLKKAFAALNETPEQLPVLKQAGVVDAGGKGFVVILEGILRALKDASPSAKGAPQAKTHPAIKELTALKPLKVKLPPEEESNFTYCTELLLTGENLPMELIKADLAPCGDCLMVVGEPSLLKIHIHTDHPGSVLEYCLGHGSLNDIKINNMAGQQKEMAGKLKGPAGPALPAAEGIAQPGRAGKPVAVVSVAAGPGLARIMENLGADLVVDGGQTLNPSTGEILKAIEEAPSNRVLVLPNNKNIILAAKQAAALSGKEVTVVPSRSVPQGLAALLTLNAEDSPETAGLKMAGALETVVTGEIARAVRNTIYQDLTIRKGDLIGILDGDLKVSGNRLEELADNLLSLMVEGAGEGKMITIYYGEQVAAEEAEKILDHLQQKHQRQEFDLQEGGQPVYDLIISVE